MKNIPCLLFSVGLLLYTAHLSAQNFQLSVQNGYGSGTYAAGDTVHIWSAEWPENQVFGGWTGQTNFLVDRGEWHTLVVMPAQNVTVKANTRLLPPDGTLLFENIRGRDTLKRVYSYFPANHLPPKGVVWFFHGTGGSVFGWVNEYEGRQLVNQCIADSLAVVITESEETTKEKDLNNDGNLRRWHYEADPVQNVDLANLQAIRDTFVNRGWMLAQTPNIGTGFSAGGAFAVVISWYKKWKAGIDYCTGGVAGAAENSLSPAQFCVARHDDHPEVGPEGITDAMANVQKYNDRGVCSRMFILEPSPVYPQRFHRLSTITAAQSLAIYNDLKQNNCLTLKSYLNRSQNTIEQMVLDNPQKWPSIVALGGVERSFVKDQLAVMWAAHHFHSDYNAKTLRFIRDACAGIVATKVPEDQLDISIFPNPASQSISLPNQTEQVRIMTLEGRVVLDKMVLGTPEVAVSDLPTGLYFAALRLGNRWTVVKFVKI